MRDFFRRDTSISKTYVKTLLNICLVRTKFCTYRWDFIEAQPNPLPLGLHFQIQSSYFNFWRTIKVSGGRFGISQTTVPTPGGGANVLIGQFSPKELKTTKKIGSGGGGGGGHAPPAQS